MYSKSRGTSHFWIQSDMVFFSRTHLGRIPSFGGQVLDLHALYNIVTSFGGISIVRILFYLIPYILFLVRFSFLN